MAYFFLLSLLAFTASITISHSAVVTREIPAKLPSWHYVNTSTPDATADGKTGVIIEPDLIVGKPVTPGATVTKIRFGPYTIGAGATIARNIFGNERKSSPCTNCYITAIQHGLEYEDGTIANVDTGAWLHHIVLTANESWDYVCPYSPLYQLANRIFSGGNERVPTRMNSKSKYGMDLGNSKLAGNIEIMSEASQPIKVFLTVTFEHVPKSTPGYKPAVHVWLDVTNCPGVSDFPARTGVYNVSSHDFEMKDDGELLFVTGHVHDGGTRVELLVNGQVVCNSKQLYANRRGGFVEKTDGTVLKEAVMPEGSHISDVAVCKDFGFVKKGDKLKVIAYYDETKHMQMKSKWGFLEPQMGIAQTYVGLVK